MEQVKCITFDKNAQDALPEHIKAKMKADREKAREKECLRRLNEGTKFTGRHFGGIVTPVKIEYDTLKVSCEFRGATWSEDWTLQCVLWGFEQEEYQFITE
jgi:hypothetical protein